MRLGWMRWVGRRCVPANGYLSFLNKCACSHPTLTGVPAFPRVLMWRCAPISRLPDEQSTIRIRSLSVNGASHRFLSALGGAQTLFRRVCLTRVVSSGVVLLVGNDQERSTQVNEATRLLLDRVHGAKCGSKQHYVGPLPARLQCE